MRKAVIWWLAYNTDDIKTRFPLPIKLLYIKISGTSQKLAFFRRYKCFGGTIKI